MPAHPRRHSVLPGFGLSLGFTMLYLSLIVLIPLSALFVKSSSLNWAEFQKAAFDPRAVASYKLAILASVAGAAVNAFFGFIVAWVLVRYEFPGRRLVDALVDLPFALPTAVSGITMAFVYSPHGWVGRYLVPLGINVANTPLGVTLALTFIGLPFVVRTLQPAIEDLERESEEGAACLGAGRLATFRHVVLPSISPALLTGFTLAFARALGEYGSVIFIAGNLPMKTEIPALLIIMKLESYDYAGAAAIGVVMLVMAFVLLLAVNLIQWWTRRRYEAL